MAKVLKRLHYPLVVMLACVRWYVLSVAPALSGVNDGRARYFCRSFRVHRWCHQATASAAQGASPSPASRGQKLAGWMKPTSRCMAWKYLYRSIDKIGKTIDFPLSAQRDNVAARYFFERAIAQNDQPESVTINGSAANRVAPQEFKAAPEMSIVICQVKHLCNIVEQDHRGIKRVSPHAHLQKFDLAGILLGGIEFMHMIAKGQMFGPGGNPSSAEHFYSLTHLRVVPSGFEASARLLRHNLFSVTTHCCKVITGAFK